MQNPQESGLAVGKQISNYLQPCVAHEAGFEFKKTLIANCNLLPSHKKLLLVIVNKYLAEDALVRICKEW